MLPPLPIFAPAHQQLDEKSINCQSQKVIQRFRSLIVYHIQITSRYVSRRETNDSRGAPRGGWCSRCRRSAFAVVQRGHLHRGHREVLGGLTSRRRASCTAPVQLWPVMARVGRATRRACAANGPMSEAIWVGMPWEKSRAAMRPLAPARAGARCWAAPRQMAGRSSLPL